MLVRQALYHLSPYPQLAGIFKSLLSSGRNFA
jgi:hypothetical protein